MEQELWYSLAAEVADSIAASEYSAELVRSSLVAAWAAGRKAWEVPGMSVWGAGAYFQKVQLYSLLSSFPGDEDEGLLPWQ